MSESHARLPDETRHPRRIACVTHSVPHFEVPFLRALASCPGIELKVFYSVEIGIKEQFDPLYNRPIQWGIPVLEGYDSQFVRTPLGIIPALLSGHYDAALVYGYSDPQKLAAFLACYVGRIPIIFRSTATLLEKRSRPKRIAKTLCLTPLLASFSAFLVGGSLNREYFRYYGVKDEKMFMVPFTVDVERFQKLSRQYKGHRQEIRNSWGITASTVILFVGTLIPKKGPQILLPAFASIAAEFPDVTLVVAGDGVLREDLQRYARQHGIGDRVMFLGFLNQNELPKAYAAADFVVFPSLYDETWARAINEAMASGLPVIASKKAGATADLVRDGINGLVVDAGDVGQLAAMMRHMILDREGRERMGHESEAIIESWTYDNAFPNALSAIEYACSGRANQ